MREFLTFWQMSRRLDRDARGVKHLLARLKIEPVGLTARGYRLYDAAVVLPQLRILRPRKKHQPKNVLKYEKAIAK